MQAINYNTMLMIKINFEPNMMVISNFTLWDEGEDELIAKAQDLLEEQNSSLRLGCMNMNSEQEFYQGVLTQQAIQLDMEANNVYYYVNYVLTMMNKTMSQKEIFTAMKNNLNIQQVVIRDDFKINGKNIELETLEEVFGQGNFHLIDVAKDDYSVKYLVDCLKQGKVDEYYDETGANYSVKGPIIKGNQVGRIINYLTANIAPNYEIPLKFGVYYSKVKLPNDNQLHDAMSCFWLKDNVPTVETYIFDFNKDIYGWVIEVQFVQWLRDLKPMKTNEEIQKALSEDEKEIKAKFIGEK